MTSLQRLALAQNRIKDIPQSLGQLKNLSLGIYLSIFFVLVVHHMLNQKLRMSFGEDFRVSKSVGAGGHGVAMLWKFW